MAQLITIHPKHPDAPDSFVGCVKGGLLEAWGGGGSFYWFRCSVCLAVAVICQYGVCILKSIHFCGAYCINSHNFCVGRLLWFHEVSSETLQMPSRGIYTYFNLLLLVIDCFQKCTGRVDLTHYCPPTVFTTPPHPLKANPSVTGLIPSMNMLALQVPC